MPGVTDTAARVLGNAVLRPLSGALSRRPDLWLFGHEEGAFAGNSKFLYLWVLAHRPDIEPIWITHRADVVAQLKALGLPVRRRGSIGGARAALRAGIYLYSFGPWEVSVALGGGAFWSTYGMASD